MWFLLAIAAFSIVALVIVLWLGTWVSTRMRVRRTGTPELERMVYHVPSDYFDYIGPHRASVTAFRDLVERKDLAMLDRQWPALEKDFLAAEREAGHSGRPLVMDYLLDYREHVRELMRRMG